MYHEASLKTTASTVLGEKILVLVPDFFTSLNISLQGLNPFGLVYFMTKLTLSQYITEMRIFLIIISPAFEIESCDAAWQHPL